MCYKCCDHFRRCTIVLLNEDFHTSFVKKSNSMTLYLRVYLDMSVYAKNQDVQQLGPWETIKNVENLEFDANGI